jgi:hypothetical protein
MWNHVGVESSRLYHKILIFKAGIDFVLGSFLPAPRNRFYDGNGTDSPKEIDSVDSMPGEHFAFLDPNPVFGSGSRSETVVGCMEKFQRET